MGVCYQLKQWEDNCRSAIVPLAAESTNKTAATSWGEDCNYVIGTVLYNSRQNLYNI
jgi:hypothetical protein